MQKKEIKQFKETVWDYYHNHKRNDMPWRNTTNPYYILVSEIMLQQTQVTRVTEKYNEFIKTFPTIQSLSQASLRDVLKIWQGLGYNRRAKYLKQAAEYIQNKLDGIFPSTVETLIQLPGIGHATAGAIMAYAFNKPVGYIETNVRTVYIYHFYPTKENITDKELQQLIEQTLDTKNPREWYWAIMDYGTYLKKTYKNNIHRSKHYTKQSKFENSKRQKRGKILKYLLEKKKATKKELAKTTKLRVRDVAPILEELSKEDLIQQKQTYYTLAD